MTVQNEIRTYDGAVCVITGGASGIGRAMAEELARRGAVVVVADLQAAVAEEVAAGIRSAGGRARAVELDVSDHDAVTALVRATAQEHGRLDYLVNNAGISHGMGAGARHYRIEDWRRIVEVNLMGVIHGVQAAYPLMVEQGFGHIVNTASMAGLVPSPGTTSYVTTKHAVVGLSHNLRAEAAEHGVRVSVLCPGVIRTPLLEGGEFARHVVPTSKEQYRELWEKRRPMEPEPFARASLDAVAKNRGVIIVPGSWKPVWWFFRLAPAFCMRMAAKTFRDAVTSPPTDPGRLDTLTELGAERPR